MKIALVSQEYPPETAHGGIGSQIFMRAHGLTELGHEVFVISHSTDNKRHEYLDNNVHVTRIPGYNQRLDPYTQPVLWLSYSTEVAIAIKELHSKFPLDLIVFPEYGGEGYIHLLNQTPWNHIPSIVHVHGPLVMFAHTMDWPDLDSEFYRVGSMMESASLRLADAVSASNICSAKWCVEHYGIAGTEIPVLYSGIDTSLFYPRDVPKASRPTIIFVGGVRKTKGVQLLVEAACILSKDFPDLQLKVLGPGEASFIADLKKMAADAGLPDLLVFVGNVAREDLPMYLSEAHFFAGPSFYEGGPGNVYLEAMACGIPAIACSGSGIEGIVTSMENGFLIPPRDLEALINAMRTLLADTTLCRTLGENARQYVLREADSKVCIKKLEAFYTSVSERTLPKIKEMQNAYS
jgi:glycosyltransferase involved in cell wall biosynthesis